MSICGQSEARRFHADLAPTHVLSIITPGRSYLGPRDVAPDCHLKVEFDDVEDAGLPGAPTLGQALEILSWASALPETAKLCLHGLQGGRRAPAVGLGILAAVVDPSEATAALSPFCRQAPDPNPLLVRLFDEALGLDGALVEACATRFVASRATQRRRSTESDASFDFGMLAIDRGQAQSG
ncbi:hypothetical protein [Jiella mangrovi]|uniref:Phosphatase n=1 Tax=Jiella mangrovi TaxID=2821407 RepID=A0ABS4BCQ8_9HYPH|nr:hypothetical protein [Jiella mangrovi]MBP0614317.1 hypothetical protein [Jiella mangrovi]